MTEHVPRLSFRLDPLIREANRRMRRRRFLLAATLAGILALSWLSYQAFKRLDHGPRPIAAMQVRTILGKARAQHSVHYTSSVSLGAPATAFTTADVANGRGVLRLTVRAFVTRKHWYRVAVLVVGATAYVRGRASGLQGWLFLPREKAVRYANHWISMRRGSRLFHDLAGGGTLDSFLRQITPHGRLVASVSTVNGRKVVGITGTTLGGQTYLNARPSSLLPISAGYVAAGGQGHTKISRWNEPVRVTAPAHSIPIATVRRG